MSHPPLDYQSFLAGRGQPAQPQGPQSPDLSYEAFQRQRGGGQSPAPTPPNRIHQQYLSGDLQRRYRAENEADLRPGLGEQLAGTGAALLSDVPGGEAAQAGLRVFTGRSPSYRQAVEDIQNAEDAAPAWARIPAKFTGATIAGMALPGSAAMQGATFGAASALLSSNPDEGVTDRMGNAVVQGAAGAATGKALEAASGYLGPKLALLRAARRAQSAGDQALSQRATTKLTDALNFGQAKTEAAANGGTSPAVQAVLSRPRVQPLADDIRESLALQGRPADDASVLRQVHQEITQNERALVDRLSNAPTSRPLTTRERGDLLTVKRLLRKATTEPGVKPALTMDVPAETHGVEPQITPGREALQGPIPGADVPAGPAFQLRAQPDVVRPGVEINTPAMRVQTAPAEPVPPLMPSFPQAVSEHARLAQSRDAFQRGYDLGRKLIKGTSVAGKNLEKKSSEALLEDMQQLPPEHQQSALRGLVAALKAEGAKGNPIMDRLAALSAAGSVAAGHPVIGASAIGADLATRMAQSLGRASAIQPAAEALGFTAPAPGITDRIARPFITTRAAVLPQQLRSLFTGQSPALP